MAADHRPARTPPLAGGVAASRGGAAPWPALAAVAAGLFLAVLSTTAVSVALPTIGHDLRASATDLEWTVDAYVLVYASLLLPGGVAGDRRGRKGVFILGVAVFGCGSLAAGLAPATGLLLAGRVVQGWARPCSSPAASPSSGPPSATNGSDPCCRALVDQCWGRHGGRPGARRCHRRRAGLAVGLLLNAPLAAAPRPAALVALAVIEGQDQGWTSALVLAAFAAGAGILTAFVLAERRRASPLVDVSLFLRPAFAAANFAALIVFFAFVGAIVYFSAYFQQVQGRSPVAAGLAVCPIGIAYAMAAAWSGRLVGRFGERWPLLIGLITSGLATLGLLRLEPATGIGAIWWNFALLGAGIGLCGTPMTTLALSAVDVDRAGMASAVLNAARQIGQVFGVAVLGALVYAHLPGRAGRPLDGGQRQLFVAGLHAALVVPVSRSSPPPW